MEGGRKKGTRFGGAELKSSSSAIELRLSDVESRSNTVESWHEVHVGSPSTAIWARSVSDHPGEGRHALPPHLDVQVRSAARGSYRPCRGAPPRGAAVADRSGASFATAMRWWWSSGQKRR
jgi:hypothetical protein